ncbi:MAG: hypothetical protein KGK03_11205 [Candidatus Omnitrophica bacterium]|nr:hypothetical protein [Candidatus Omnitrophota bacterium]MDE2223625.1 hypothetical protein [Candidatus Omnitrophota bacterium]
MDLYAIYTEEVVVLKDNFIKSIKDPWGINIVYWGDMGRVGDWGTGEFAKLLRRKVKFMIETIKMKMGDTIIWSDIDIQFFRPCTQAIEKIMADKDFLFLAEHWPRKEVNVGFIVIRCNPRTLAFYEAVERMDFESMPYLDQSAVNKLLQDRSQEISWDILPYQFWSKSIGGPPPRDILLHHANVTFPGVVNGRPVSSLEQKFEQFDQIRNFIHSYPLWKWLGWGKLRFWAKAILFRMGLSGI